MISQAADLPMDHDGTRLGYKLDGFGNANGPCHFPSQAQGLIR